MISANELELLIQALKDESIDGEDRRNAAEVLGKIKDSKAFDPLIQYFKDPAQYNFNQRILVRTLDELLRNRSAAGEALVMIGEPAIQPLIQILEDEDYRLSDAARALNDNISFIRCSAVRALGRIDGAHVIGPLIQALKDSDSEVRTRAEEFLGRFLAQSASQKEQSKKIRLQFW